MENITEQEIEEMMKEDEIANIDYIDTKSFSLSEAGDIQGEIL